MQENIIRSVLAKNNGIEIKTMGDAFLIEFPSALQAVRCAVDIQRTLHEYNRGHPTDSLISLRIGIHLGDVIHEKGDVYGDAVNIAARIEPLATPGGACISEQVYAQVKNKLEFPMPSLGRKSLKNVSDEIELFRILFPWENKGDQPTREHRPDLKRIAVLPFTNISPDPKDEYFADGMTEELISTLSGIRALRVISRTSVMIYKQQTGKSLSDIARELDVAAVLEGSVRKAGEKLRITVQLIDAKTSEHMWAERYDRELKDVFSIQSEISNAPEVDSILLVPQIFLGEWDGRKMR